MFRNFAYRLQLKRSLSYRAKEVFHALADIRDIQTLKMPKWALPLYAGEGPFLAFHLLAIRYFCTSSGR
jgi:hypothetical protein